MNWSNVAVFTFLVAVLMLTAVHTADEFECYSCSADPINPVTLCSSDARVMCAEEWCISYTLTGNPPVFYRGCITDLGDSVNMFEDMTCNSTNTHISGMTCCDTTLCNK